MFYSQKLSLLNLIKWLHNKRGCIVYPFSLKHVDFDQSFDQVFTTSVFNLFKRFKTRFDYSDPNVFEP
jgi:hypothetical protein